jgi:hypothetical protein
MRCGIEGHATRLPLMLGPVRRRRRKAKLIYPSLGDSAHNPACGVKGWGVGLALNAFVHKR